MNETPIAPRGPIVIVEDEPAIARILQDYLTSHGFVWEHFVDAQGVADWVKHHDPACVLLDVMLPQSEVYGDGLALCREIRAQSDVPIIMLTARIEEIDRILGLEIGADDYVCKPFSPREVIARIKALLRRRTPSHPQEPNRHFWLDEDRCQVHYVGRACEVSAVEFGILKALAKSPGRIYSRSHLIEVIYPDHRLVSDRTIDSHIKKLRQKLNSALGENELIQSVYGVGYKLAPD